MTATKARFEQAHQDAKNLPRRPDNETMLKLYALFKQATQGDAEGERPGGFDFVGQAKFDAWSELRGTSQDAAMQDYIALVDRLKQ